MVADIELVHNKLDMILSELADIKKKIDDDTYLSNEDAQALRVAEKDYLEGKTKVL